MRLLKPSAILLAPPALAVKLHVVELHSDCVVFAGPGCAEVVAQAQQLLQRSLLGELRVVVARALSGLDMFAGHNSQAKPASVKLIDSAEVSLPHAFPV